MWQLRRAAARRCFVLRLIGVPLLPVFARGARQEHGDDADAPTDHQERRGQRPRDDDVGETHAVTGRCCFMPMDFVRTWLRARHSGHVTLPLA